MNKSKTFGLTPEEYKKARRTALLSIRPHILLMLGLVVGYVCLVVVVLGA